MPPKRAAKQPTTTTDAPPTPEQAQTPPPHSPTKQPAGVGITQAQKQALIDNLQLEITERARKLRAQYALQAQSLRSRLEMRVNRIPAALRKRKLGELVEEFAPKPPPSQQEAVVRDERKSLKRGSDQISTISTHDFANGEEHGEEDKENAQPASQNNDLANPKKRVKTTTSATIQAAPVHQANTKATRTTSRTAKPTARTTSTVLSPRSHNSRTLPKSPFKSATSPEKTIQFVPAKPVPAQKARTASRQQQPSAVAAKKQAKGRAAAESETEDSRTSEASTTSAGTTVITKGGKGGGRAPTAAPGGKKGGAGAGRKKNEPTVASQAAATAVMGGGRSLRKRA